MRALYLAWQAPTRAWFPVGLLEARDDGRYAFRYTKGALAAKTAVGFQPLASFPSFEARYLSAELFPLFRNRVLDPHRSDFADYLRSLDLSPNENDPIEILAVTGGKRETDSFEVFPKIRKAADGSFSCRFFVHGLRHLSEAIQRRASQLQPGEDLGVSIELTNPATTYAMLLATRDYSVVGWAPRYLLDDLLRASGGGPSLRATVVRVNADEVPANRRVLVELTGRLPANIEPMSGAEFQPIAA